MAEYLCNTCNNKSITVGGNYQNACLNERCKDYAGPKLKDDIPHIAELRTDLSNIKEYTQEIYAIGCLAAWNEAIEYVAKHLDEMGEEARISEYVREMKK